MTPSTSSCDSSTKATGLGTEKRTPEKKDVKTSQTNVRLRLKTTTTMKNATTKETAPTKDAREGSSSLESLLQSDEEMSQRGQEAMAFMHSQDFINVILPENPPKHKFNVPQVIGFRVSVSLERTKDQKRPKRVHLAEDVRNILRQGFSKVGYTELNPSIVQECEAKLFVDIAVASDGNRLGRVCCGEFHAGAAKLVVVWSLQSVKTGEVLMGHRCVKVDTISMGGGPWAVKNLAYSMVDHITVEVNKTCCHQRPFSSSSLMTRSKSDPYLNLS